MLIPFVAAQSSFSSSLAPRRNGKTEGDGVGVVSFLEENRHDSKQTKKEKYRAAERHNGDRRPTKAESPSSLSTKLISTYLTNRGVPIPLSLHSCKHNMLSSYNIRPVEEFRDEEYPQLKGKGGSFRRRQLTASFSMLS
jgi:hypothetical protein